MAGEFGLDHAGAIVRDLRATAGRWEQLGFTLSPETRQRGKMLGRDDESPWGTANRCAIFRQGYLEVIGVVDPAAFNPWAAFLDRFEGLHICALRAASGDAAYARLSSMGDNFRPPIDRERKIGVDGREETIRFRNIFSRDERFPEGRWIVIEHCTPELIWQERYLDHANGAQALEAVTMVGGPELERRIRPFAPPDVTVVSPEAFVERYGWKPPALPAMGAVTIRFADREAAARLMERAGAVVQRNGADWFLGPDQGNGFVMRLA